MRIIDAVCLPDCEQKGGVVAGTLLRALILDLFHRRHCVSLTSRIGLSDRLGVRRQDVADLRFRSRDGTSRRSDHKADLTTFSVRQKF